MKKNTFTEKVFPLFLTFLKIGAFTFGGGYAMIPIIHREIAERRKWLTDEDILDIIAVSESTPGPIAINSATFVGYKIAGFWGAFFATLGTVAPSFAIIFIISLFLRGFMKIELVKRAFFGIRAAVAVLIVDAAIKLKKSVKVDIYAVVVIVSVLALEILSAFFSFGVSSVLLILTGAVGGAVLYGIARIGEKEDKK